MNYPTGRRGNKTRKHRARATRKPKIRWEVLGLPNSLDTSLPPSMADIRRQASSLASRGLGQETLVRYGIEAKVNEGERSESRAGDSSAQ